MPNKIDSNATGLAFAEETSIGTLPGTPKWRALEPNSYNDFGGEITTIARNPINISRQRKKGVVTDLEASGGFNSDFVPYLTRLMQGFFFAAAREKMNTVKYDDGSSDITITGVTTGPDTYTAASGLDGFQAGDLVYASGFTNAANNGLKTVTTAASGVLTVAETLVTEGSPPAAAKIEVCGFKCDEGDVAVDLTSGVVTLTSTTTDFTDFNLIVGEWIYLGGDATDNKFANNQGFARVRSITATAIVLEELSWTPQTEAAGSLDIHVFFGTVIKNENTSNLIVTKSYQLERQLGNDGSGIQSEYVAGALCNELSLNLSAADKATIDLDFVAQDHETYDGSTGIKSGTRISAPVQDAYNTSSDIVRTRLYVHDDTTYTPTNLIQYMDELTVTINNNASGLKSIGVLGNFDVNIGTFEVGGSVDAYFQTIAAQAAIRANSDLGFNTIFAKANAGIVFDMPLLSLGGGRLEIEQDEPVKLPLENSAAESVNNYTLLFNHFPYLPDAAMP